MTVYSNIKKIADKKGVSIYRLERDLHFSNGLIAKWDRCMPHADKLQKVADYLDVNASSFLKNAK